MYRLKSIYGKKTFDVWTESHVDDLADTQSSHKEANNSPWPVKSFRELTENVAFLSSMNKRMVLYFRGQSNPDDPFPSLFREKWMCFDSDLRLSITDQSRKDFWDALEEIGQIVYEISKNIGLPRWRGIRDVREAKWAIIQHYGLWPTPLIDITNSLRIAASFALNFKMKDNPDRYGYVFVVGLPNLTGSISFDIDQNLILARLQGVCPPIAKRPHYQDAYLVGRFPLISYRDFDSASKIRKSNLTRRLIAKFELFDDGSFWDDDFPIVSKSAVFPPDDPLLREFLSVFGHDKEKSILERAMRLSNAI